MRLSYRSLSALSEVPVLRRNALFGGGGWLGLFAVSGSALRTILHGVCGRPLIAEICWYSGISAYSGQLIHLFKGVQGWAAQFLLL